MFAAADGGDAVALSLVDRQADEIVAFVRACVERLELAGTAVPVVLGGGILDSVNDRLLSRVEAGWAQRHLRRGS